MIVKDVWSVDIDTINKYENVVKTKFGIMNRDVYVCWNDKDELLKKIKPINKDEVAGKVLKKYMVMNYDGHNISINLNQMLSIIHMTIEAVEDICKKNS